MIKLNLILALCFLSACGTMQGGRRPAQAAGNVIIASPTKLVNTIGGAYTECQDQSEQQQTLKNRAICVNQAGEYYFLVEETPSNGIVAPVNLVRSNGKAYTECQDESEKEFAFKNRQICVSPNGDYYFLASE